MSYIGNQPPDIGAYDVESFDGGGTSFTLKRAATVSSVLLFIDGVRQTPTDAYAVSGVTLTTTATTPSGTDNVTVMFMGDVVDIGAPSADTVSTATIQDDAVTAAKLANSINTEITANTAKVTNATHTGDVTGATALTIATDAVDIAMLSATGTASATTFLRGDNAWATPPTSDGTPMWDVNLSSNQTLTDSTWEKVLFDTERIDSDGAFASNKFTVPVGGAGKYLVYTNVSASANGGAQLDQYRMSIYKNGSAITLADWDGGSGQDNNISSTRILDLAEADYLEVYVRLQDTSGSPTAFGGTNYTWFGGYKIA
jgi:hypothetical protein